MCQRLWNIYDSRVWFYFACEVTDIPVHLLQQKMIKFGLLLKGLENEAVAKSRKLSDDEKSVFQKKKDLTKNTIKE